MLLGPTDLFPFSFNNFIFIISGVKMMLHSGIPEYVFLA